MALTTGATNVTGLPTGTSVQTANASVTYSDAQTLNQNEKLYVNSTSALIGIDGANASLTINAIPRGDWDAATAYAVGDAVKHNDVWYECLTANTNSEPTLTNNNWRVHTVDHAESIIQYGNYAANGAMGANIFLRTQNQGAFNLWNTTVKTAGGINFEDPTRGQFPTIRMDEVVFYNTNTARSPYVRTFTVADSGATVTFPNNSYIGSLTLDGDTRPFGIYEPSYFAQAGCEIGSLTLRNGIIVGHGSNTSSFTNGTLPASGYFVKRNIDATTNKSRLTDSAGNSWKVDLFTACNTFSGDADIYVHEFVNSADGLGLGFWPREGLVNESQRRSHAIISSEFNIQVNDLDGNPIEGAVIYVPSQDDVTSISNGGETLAFSTTLSTNIFTNSGQTAFQDDTTLTLTTGANGNTGTQKAVLGYFQYPTSMTAAQRQRLGSTTHFPRVGNTATVTIRAYGYDETTLTIDLRGTGEKTYTATMLADENITLSEADAGALTGISVQPNRIEDTASRPAIIITRDGVTYQEIYDYWKWYHTRPANFLASDISVTVANGRIRFGNYATRTEMYEIALDADGHLSTDTSVFNGFAPGTVVDHGQPASPHETHDDDDYTGLIVVDPSGTLDGGTYNLTTNDIYFYIDTAGTYRLVNSNVTTGAGNVIFVIAVPGVNIITDIPANVIQNGATDATSVVIGGITYTSTESATFSISSSKLTITGVGIDESISIYTDAAKTTRPTEYPNALTGSTSYDFEAIPYTGTGTFNVWVVVTDADGETRSKKFALTASLEDQTFDFTLNASIGQVTTVVNAMSTQVTTAKETAEWLQTGGKLLGIKPLARNFTDWKANQ